jgi:hypothetical protein
MSEWIFVIAQNCVRWVKEVAEPPVQPQLLLVLQSHAFVKKGIEIKGMIGQIPESLR